MITSSIMASMHVTFKISDKVLQFDKLNSDFPFGSGKLQSIKRILVYLARVKQYIFLCLNVFQVVELYKQD